MSQVTKSRGAEEIQSWLVKQISERLGKTPEEIDIREPFNNFGLSSKEAIVLSGDLEEWLKRRLSPTLLFEYPDIESMSRYLAGEAEVPASGAAAVEAPKTGLEPVAIIGIGCRFPKAGGPEAFLELLQNGVDAITEVPEDRWALNSFHHPDVGKADTMNIRWGGFLDQVDLFDPLFFGISPREAANMDPQQRLLLEVAWEALEDGGQSAERLSGTKTGVFIGISTNDYGLSRLTEPGFNDLYMSTGNASSIAANRISYVFGFQGPSMAIDTACSSSLVAIHLACQSLCSGESALALAGGVNVILSPYITMNFSKAGFLAADGRCKTFDARADGYVRGEGAGVVVLKLLSAALADDDPVYAVIRGSAANQDGRSNGLTAPNGRAQAEVLREAYRKAKVSPGQVRYVEAHGTGTALGDPIEAKALGSVLAAGRSPGNPCRIGSVKSNFGHLEAAAGIAGVIKVALSLKHGFIPPSLHFQKPNPHIPFAELQLQVQQQRGPWPDIPGPALAGVSSFGFGGTNVHVVMEEAPTRPVISVQQKREYGTRAQLLPLSARSEEALTACARSCREFLNNDLFNTPEAIYDACYTAAMRRDFHDHRLSILGRSKEELSSRVDSFLKGEANVAGLSSGQKPLNRRPGVVFVFSGQGSEWPGMGGRLLEQEPVFRSVLESCDREIRHYAEWSLIKELKAGKEHSRLNELDVLQPALFSLQVAAAALWRSWGIEPDAVIGYSLGEIAAAHVSGALGLAEGIKVICTRSRLLKQMKSRGKIAVVELPLQKAREVLTGYENRVFIAASSSPTITVLSGEPQALQELLKRLENQGVYCLPETGEVAFHTRQLQPMCSEFLKSLEGLTHQPAVIPVYSTVTGTYDKNLEFSAEYWVKNLKEPVLFSPALKTLFEDGYNTFIEISPHPIHLSSIHEQLHSLRKKGVGLPSLRRKKDEREVMLGSLGTLYTLGFQVEWSKLYPVPGRCLRLPSYPWQRVRCWIEERGGKSGRFPGRGYSHDGRNLHPLIGQYLNSAVEQGMYFWEMELGIDLFPYLQDHCVQGAAVVPGAAYIEMARAAAEAVFAPGLHVLEKVEFKKALFLPDEGSQKVQLVISTEEEGTVKFRIFSLQASSEGLQPSWMLHADGIIRVNRDESPGKHASPAETRSKCPEAITGEEHYRLMDRRGLQYGAAFQGVEQIQRRDGEAIARIRLPKNIVYEAEDYGIHPALLDACFQVLGAAPTEKYAGITAGHTFLPVGIDSFRMFNRPPADTPLWAHALLRYDAEKNAAAFAGDIFLSDEQGQVIFAALGLKLQRIDFGLPGDKEEDFHDWLYEIRWEPGAGKQGERVWEETPPGQQGSWLIFTGKNGVGQELKSLLEKRGETCIMVSPAETAKISQAGQQYLNPACPEDFHQLLKETFSGQRLCRGVIHLWSLDSTQVEEKSAALSLEKDQELCSFSVLHLVQALAHAGWRQAPRLWLVTRNVHAVGAGAGEIAVSQSTLWGLGRVISLEHPEFHCTMVDLGHKNSTEEIKSLFEELGAEDHEDQVALRGTDRYVARLAQIPGEFPAAAEKPAALNPDSTYLITGGLGGLGLTFARWLVEKGARHLVLMGRGKPSPTARAALKAMKEMGALPKVVKADVSRVEQLTAALHEIEQSMPPLRGIIHGAGLLDDAILLQTTQESFAKVMAPKIRGTWNLHTLTLDKPLDFFVLFSSAASMIGSPGQGNYSAANAFLDALAFRRRALRLPALCINWGPWAEVGLAARADRAEQLASRGVVSIPPQQGVAALEFLLGREKVQVGVMPMDWLRYRRLHPADYELPLLTHLIPKGAELTAAGRDLKEKGRVGREILSMNEFEERKRLVTSYLREHVAKALGIPSPELDLQRPLNTLGIDSLMAVEIKNRIEFDMNLVVSMVQFLKGPTVDQLTTALLEQLAAGVSAPSVSVSQETGAGESEGEKAEQLLQKIDQLSNEEVDSILGDMLASEEKSE